jgi:hypothetical protein
MMMKMIFGAIGGMNLAGETKVLGGNLPGATLSTTKSHMTARSRTPDCSGGKPATNHLSYGAAYMPVYSNGNCWFQKHLLYLCRISAAIRGVTVMTDLISSRGIPNYNFSRVGFGSTQYILCKN